MCDAFDRYLAASGNRDKVMAIAQFLPLMLYGPAKTAGCATLSKSLHSLSAMADAYRAVTRLTLLSGALSRPTLESLTKPKGDLVIERIDQISHAFHVFFCLFENTAVLSSRGVYPASLARLGGCAVTCWFYVLVLGIVKTLYKLTQKTLTPKEKQESQVALLKLSCYLVFSTSCVPAGGPQLLENASGPLAPLHDLIRMIAPRHVAMPDTIRGALGLVASLCEFY